MSQKPLILIAEYDSKFRQLLYLTLQEEYRLLFSKDGFQALEQVKKKSPDLILMGAHMPKLNGWQVIREIRALRNRVPIIVITGVPDPLNKPKAEKLGVADCLSKPFDPKHLKRLIREQIVEARA